MTPITHLRLSGYCGGTGDVTKTDDFQEKNLKGGRGGWVIFKPRIYVAGFGLFNRAFVGLFPKKLQHNFPKKGGGAKAVCKFIRFGSATRP